MPTVEKYRLFVQRLRHRAQIPQRIACMDQNRRYCDSRVYTIKLM